MEDENKEKKGAAFKAYGIIMMVLSSLNLLFCWRGGFPVYPLYPIIMVVGVVSFSFGAIRGR